GRPSDGEAHSWPPRASPPLGAPPASSSPRRSARRPCSPGAGLRGPGPPAQLRDEGSQVGPGPRPHLVGVGVPSCAPMWHPLTLVSEPVNDSTLMFEMRATS
ncbi:unnamed protein product, partial [Prorocentrum cordatum]